MEDKIRKIVRKILKESINEKAVSKSQQQFMGMVHNCQQNPEDCDKYGKSIKDAAKGMTQKDAEDFASTKHKGLPKHVEEGDALKEFIEKEIKALKEQFTSKVSDGIIKTKSGDIQYSISKTTDGYEVYFPNNDTTEQIINLRDEAHVKKMVKLVKAYEKIIFAGTSSQLFDLLSSSIRF